ncbi:AraC family transcriptional regulator [Paludibacter sp.]|uniref:helix-turn-helix domain-containing protein n=1 Tax=Paludibacter sp. TaxID=1898105 RepID=UPI001354E7D8|nr:AraC family transcriptional regulator [Paludibacter sp.]MTK52327.1 helix-turn-helix transcriptional regulator [Paludibacter sp.]
MNHLLYVLLTNALAASCLIFAIIFITLPLPPNAGLKNYRISLRILFVAYVASAFIAVVDKVLVNVLSMILLSMCSFLILLFSTALINLLHPERITRKFILIHISPLVFLNLLYWIGAIKFGNPMLGSLSQVMQNLIHPQILIRIATWLMCVTQLVYFGRSFKKEATLYNSRLDECFSENMKLHLPWVRICYDGALLLGGYALVISLVNSPVALMTFFSVLAVFFIVFGVCYIQYPRTYVQIEQVFHPLTPEIGQVPKQRHSWGKLKKQVLDQKYYLAPSVSIEEMAQLLQIGRTTLSGFINKEEGVNFNAWVGSLRIEEAMRIFRENPQLSIAQVSELVGYSEPSNFSRQFKMITGVSPSEWYRQRQQSL